MTRSITLTTALAALVGLSGCALVPAAGPRTSAIVNGAQPSATNPVAPYVLIDLDTAKAKTLASRDGWVPTVPRDTLPPGKPIGILGVGDGLKITIWQPEPTGATLIDKDGLEVTVRVDSDGTVSVPYAGRVRAAGRLPRQVENEISAVLTRNVKGVSVSVLVVDDITNNVILQGDIAKPGRSPLIEGAHGLLDVISEAGGPRDPKERPVIRVRRDGVDVSRTLAQIVANHDLDIQLSPGDRVLVTPQEQFFYAFGAVQKPGDQAYDADDISLARVLARIAGLDTNRANPNGVFIYRHQKPSTTLAIAPVSPGQDPAQVIYHLDMRDPATFFVAQNFRVLPEDIVYVSDAPLAEASKVVNLISGLSSVGAMPRNLGAPY